MAGRGCPPPPYACSTSSNRTAAIELHSAAMLPCRGGSLRTICSGCARMPHCALSCNPAVLPCACTLPTRLNCARAPPPCRAPTCRLFHRQRHLGLLLRQGWRASNLHRPRHRPVGGAGVRAGSSCLQVVAAWLPGPSLAHLFRTIVCQTTQNLRHRPWQGPAACTARAAACSKLERALVRALMLPLTGAPDGCHHPHLTPQNNANTQQTNTAEVGHCISAGCRASAEGMQRACTAVATTVAVPKLTCFYCPRRPSLHAPPPASSLTTEPQTTASPSTTAG